jgi:hypothetical protein
MSGLFERWTRGWARRATLALGLGMVVALGGTLAQAQAPQGPTAQGTWKSGDTTIRVAINKTEARAQFVEVGQGAKGLGFKPGDVSFVAAVMGNMLHGEQTVRYGPQCHANGRKVPMMGRLRPDGQVLAIHFYMISTDPNCRDTGEYRITETLWQRVADR